MPADGSLRLAARQAELVQALLAGGTPPCGFDPAHLQAAAAALARKRWRAAAHAWPKLAQALGDRFAQRFWAYAAYAALPRDGSALADGRNFARALAGAGELPDEGRLEALVVDLRYARTAHGLRPRREPALRIVRLRQSRRLAFGVRVPGLRECCFCVPFV